MGAGSHYTEQVVRLVGQAIWYDRPPAVQIPSPYPPPGDRGGGGSSGGGGGIDGGDVSITREALLTKFGLPVAAAAASGGNGNVHSNGEGIVLYLCAQSAFKLHPEYDKVRSLYYRFSYVV